MRQVYIQETLPEALQYFCRFDLKEVFGEVSNHGSSLRLREPSQNNFSASYGCTHDRGLGF
jgi:hypothetical protein